MKNTVLVNVISAEELDQMLMELDTHSAIMIIGEDEILVHDSYGSQRFDATDGDYPNSIAIRFKSSEHVTFKIIPQTKSVAKATAIGASTLEFELVEFTTEDRQNGYGVYFKAKEES